MLCLRVRLSKGEQGKWETDGAEGQQEGKAFRADLFCSGRTFSLGALRMKKRERIPRPRDLSSALPAGTIGLAGAQFLLRNRKHPWMDQARSEPVPLMSFSKNYQSWVKSRPSSPVNTINSNG